MAVNYAIVLTACAALATGPTESPPVVSVLVDDLGYRLRDGMAAIELPGPIAYAILPHAPHAARLAESAHARRKEVVLHLPMEAVHNNHLLGPDAITAAMDAKQIERVFQRALTAVPHAAGVSNHMGSKLTRELASMRWIMSAASKIDGLFFIDSRTTAGSVAAIAAREAELPFTARDVFLDNIQSARYIEHQLRRLTEKARDKGSALGIAHPHPTSIAVLSAWRPEQFGVRLVSLAELIRRQQAATRIPRQVEDRSVLSGSECGDHGREADAAQDPYTHRQRAE